MISLQDVKRAKDRISHLIRRTPLIRSQFLSDYCGGEVYLKLENQQLTNSFKIRGALNRMLHLNVDEIKKGVITASAGNHGQAVAMCAEKLNTYAKIVVPMNTPKTKIEKIRRYNVDLMTYGEIYDEAEQKAKDLAKKEELTYISPYNDELIIAGQGTIALEILEELNDVNVVLVPVGGGGLISGIGVAVKGVNPSANIVGVQSEASPVMYESLKAGRIISVEMQHSIADGLHGGIEEGAIIFKITQSHIDDLRLVKEETIKRAIYLLWKKESQITEGAGATAIAAILEEPLGFQKKTVTAVISGGNIEDTQFQSLLESETERAVEQKS